MKKADGKQIHELLRELCGAWRAVEEVEEAVHSACGMTGGQNKSIGHLLEGGPMTVSDLAFDRNVSRQSVQVAVNAMVGLGYVRLVDNPRHKKAKLVEVTNLGRERHQAAIEAEREIIRKVFPDLDAADVQTTTNMLRLVRDAFDRPQNPITEPAVKK